MSVYADLEGQCKRGLAVEYDGRTLFVGNGIAELSRRELFSPDAKNRYGYQIPIFSNIVWRLQFTVSLYIRASTCTPQVSAHPCFNYVFPGASSSGCSTLQEGIYEGGFLMYGMEWNGILCKQAYYYYSLVAILLCHSFGQKVLTYKPVEACGRGYI